MRDVRPHLHSNINHRFSDATTTTHNTHSQQHPLICANIVRHCASRQQKLNDSKMAALSCCCQHRRVGLP